MILRPLVALALFVFILSLSVLVSADLVEAEVIVIGNDTSVTRVLNYTWLDEGSNVDFNSVDFCRNKRSTRTGVSAGEICMFFINFSSVVGDNTVITNATFYLDYGDAWIGNGSTTQTIVNVISEDHVRRFTDSIYSVPAGKYSPTHDNNPCGWTTRLHGGNPSFFNASCNQTAQAQYFISKLDYQPRITIGFDILHMINAARGKTNTILFYLNDSVGDFGSYGSNEPIQITSLDGPRRPRLYLEGSGFSPVPPLPDPIAPTITAQSPTNTTYMISGAWANLTLDEAGSVVFRSLDGGANISLTNSSGNWNNKMTGLSKGPHRVTFYANDTAGNNAQSTITIFFTVEKTVPTITVQQPANTTFASSTLWVNVTLDDMGSIVLRSLDGGVNVSLTNSSGNWNNQMTGLSNGSHRVTVYANDSIGSDSTPVTMFFTMNTTVSVSNAINVTSLSDGSVSKSLDPASRTIYIKTYKNTSASYTLLKLTSIPLQTTNSTPIVNLSNGDFENGLSGWGVWADPNNCAVDTKCEPRWCNILKDASCIVSGLKVNITNETGFGTRSVFIGHDRDWGYTYWHSKIDLRRDISLTNLNGEYALLSFNKRTHRVGGFENKPRDKLEEDLTYIYDIVVISDGRENLIWSRGSTSPLLTENWSPEFLDISGYAGKNITIAFRIKHEFRRWDTVWSDTRLLYLDDIKVISANSTRVSSIPETRQLILDSPSYIYPVSPSLDVGNDGTKEWTYSGIIDTSVYVSDFSNAISNYLSICTVDTSDNKCIVPLVFHSDSDGLMNISDIQIQMLDSVKPQISNISFKTNSYIYNETQSISVNVTDNSQIDSVNVTLVTPAGNQRLKMSLSGGQNWNGIYSYVLGTSNMLPPGSYSFYTTATDILGNFVNSSLYNYTRLNNKQNIGITINSGPVLRLNRTGDLIILQGQVSIQDISTFGTLFFNYSLSNATHSIPIDARNISWLESIGRDAYDSPTCGYSPYMYCKFRINNSKLHPNSPYNLTFNATDLFGNFYQPSVVTIKPQYNSKYDYNLSEGTQLLDDSKNTNASLLFHSASVSGSISITTYNQTPSNIRAYDSFNTSLFVEFTPSWENVYPSLPSGSWAEIRIHYTDQQIANLSLDESALKLMYYNETTHFWQVCGNGGVNKTGNYVFCNSTHFSVWGITGNPTSTGSPSSPSSSSSSPASSGSGGSGGGGGGVGVSTITTTGSSDGAETVQIEGTAGEPGTDVSEGALEESNISVGNNITEERRNLITGMFASGGLFNVFSGILTVVAVMIGIVSFLIWKKTGRQSKNLKA